MAPAALISITTWEVNVSLSLMKRYCFVCVVFAMMFLTASSFAQTPNFPTGAQQGLATPLPPTYPWDTRPPKCRVPGAPPFFMCKLDNWPGPEQTVYRLKLLYFNEDYSLLERALAELTTPSRQFSDGAFSEELIADALSGAMNGSTQESEEERRLALWRKAFPDSPYLELTQVYFMHAKAWKARGEGYASSVSKESWELFHIRLREAEQALLKASPRLKDTPEWYRELLAISFDLGAEHEDPSDVYEHAIKRWPAYASFQKIVIWRLVPQWGGNWPSVEAFARKSTGLQPPSEGKSLYARLYMHLLGQASAEEMGFDWNLMKASFDDLIARHPDARYKNLYASFACFEKDKDAFGKAMRVLPQSDVVPGWWLNGNSYDACLRWGGT